MCDFFITQINVWLCFIIYWKIIKLHLASRCFTIYIALYHISARLSRLTFVSAIYFFVRCNRWLFVKAFLTARFWNHQILFPLRVLYTSRQTVVVGGKATCALRYGGFFELKIFKRKLRKSCIANCSFSYCLHLLRTAPHLS